MLTFFSFAVLLFVATSSVASGVYFTCV